MTINFKDWQKNLHEARKCEEELKGNQHKLDVDKDGKIEGEDLAKLRKMKKEETELSLEDFTIEELEEFMMSEEFEQLDELNKKTLASYVKKASSSAVRHASKEQEAGDEGDYDTAYKHADKYTKRLKGISKASDKLAKEESSCGKKKMYREFVEEIYEARRKDEDEDEDEYEEKGEEKIEKRADRKSDRLGRKYPVKMKVHTGEDDGKQVTEEIEDLDESDYGWDTKETKSKGYTTRKISGTRYGGSAQKDEPEDDDDDDEPKKKKPAADQPKRGRGRPKGTASGARLKGSSGKSSYGGLAIHSLNLPNGNK